MKSKTIPLLVVAVAVLLAGVVPGAVSAVADDRASFDDRDRVSAPNAIADGANGVADDANATAGTQSRPVEPDAVVLDVQVYGNGTATWTVSYRVRLDDATTAAAFRDYAGDVENDSRRYRGQFAERMNRTVRTAERATGREMRGTDYSVRAETHRFPERYGVVSYSFRWHGFANVSGDRIRVGGALAGLVLDEKTKLVVERPEGYELTAIRPRPETGFEERERSVVWTGPIEFAGDEPRLVLSPPGTSGTDGGDRPSYDPTGVRDRPSPVSHAVGPRSRR